MKSKYSKDGPFTDPVVRCDGCKKIFLRVDIQKIGGCPYCGHKKVKNLMGFNEEEWEQMKGWGVDPDFLKLFEAREVQSG